MGRISDELIERLKSEVSLVRLAESQGYALKKQGKDYALSCPFHSGDETPSLIISPASNLFNCFGCDAGGSVIDWVMKTQGVSFRLACEILQNDVDLVVGTKPVKQSTTKTLASSLAAGDDAALLGRVVDYYHETLKQSPEALEYLGSRGLNDPALINTFKLGFANRTLGYRLPAKNRKAGAELRGQLQTLGILRSSGHEHFNGSLVVPVQDEHGQVLELYGRKILGNRLRKGTPQHLYLPGPHAGVWNAAGLAGSREVILCEALIDAMTFWVHGFRHVTASYGTGGFTEDHLALFSCLGLERVLIAYDRDNAGNRAAESLAERLMAAGFECFRVLLPKGMDVNEYALTMSPADKALGLAIRKAEWLGQGQAPNREVAPVMDGNDHHCPPSTPPEPPSGGEVEASNEPEVPEMVAPLPESEASPLPVVPASAALEVEGQDLHLTQGDRAYRVRGLDNQTGADQLRINLMVRRGGAFHMDRLNLYSSKQRQVFMQQASLELGVGSEVIKADLGKLLLALEAHQEAQRAAEAPVSATITLDQEAREAALALLKAPDLLSRILADFARAGVVGEETNKLVGYLACVSRQLERPLAVIIQSSSAAGKSSLMESILALMPEEDRVQYSAMTGQSLFYMGETNLKHKILAIAEEEGAHHASYALKLLQSEGEITIASTGKDEASGNLVTKEYTVEGPVMLFLTTTAIDIDEELMNRCLVLSVNEDRAQTQAIHRAQRERRMLAGLQARLERDAVLALHRNAQRLLKPLPVINPYADQLTFLDNKTRTRRDHEKYLSLIDSIALLHQYQRETKTVMHNGEAVAYIEVTLDDIEVANRLAHEVLGKTLDELPPQTRKLLRQIVTMVEATCTDQSVERGHCRFSRKTIRDYTGWSDGQLKIHCKRLEEMEYLLVHRGGRGQAMEYELLYTGDGQADQPQLMGLLNVDHFQNSDYDAQKSGVNGEKTGPSQAQVRPLSGSSQPPANPSEPSDAGTCEEEQLPLLAVESIPPNSDASHPSHSLALAEG